MATLKQLHTFVTVAETLKMSEAAKRLYLSQSTVSQTISDLEKEFDLVLFIRFAKSLQLTSQGKLFLSYATQVVESYEQLNHSVRYAQSVRELRVGATITIGNTIFSKIIGNMKQQYPDIEPHLFVENTQQLEHRLLHNEIDIALIEGVIIDSKIVKLPLAKDLLQVICSREHPFWGQSCIMPGDLKGQRFILREQGSGTRKIFEDYMHTAKIPITVVGESTSSTAIIEMVINNLGLGVLSRRCVERYTSESLVHACNIVNMPMPREFYICYNSKSPLLSQMTDFIDAAHQYISSTDGIHGSSCMPVAECSQED